MSAAPRRPMPTSKSGLVLTPKVEPIHTAPPATAGEDEHTVPEPATSVEAPVEEPNVEPATSDESAANGAAKQASRPARSSTKGTGKKARKQASARPAGEAVAPTPDEGTKGPEDRTRASNVQLPTSLYEQVEAKCLQRKLTHGELILVAVESTYDRLKELIHPNETIGGKLFAARASNSNPTSEAGFKTPMNYRLREGDFAVLDHVATEFSARSRNHLIVAALTGYLGQK